MAGDGALASQRPRRPPCIHGGLIDVNSAAFDGLKMRPAGLRMRGIAFERKGASMQKWRCVLCSYVYDPNAGDPDGNVPPGTPFEKVPGDWVCPLCGAPKSEFEPVE